MRRHSNWFGVDSAQLLSLFARISQIGTGFVTLVFVGLYFDLQTQGYFYTFSSLVALQVFAEMGLGTVLIQFSAHEMAKLSWQQEIVVGDAAAKARLRALLTFSMGWFGATATLLMTLLIPGGYWFFQHAASEGLQGDGTLVSWVILVILVSANLVVTAACNLLEGTGKVSEIAAVRLAQSAIGAMGAWIGIASGAGLSSLALQNGLMLLVGSAYLLTRRRRFFADLLRTTPQPNAIAWRSDILPFQWRIAISWLSGYFVFQLLTPLVFAARGAEAAGQLGMSMQIFSAISSVCVVLVTARVPAFGRLVATRARSELHRLFARSAAQSFAVLILMLIATLAALAALPSTPFSFGSRVVPLPQAALLALACVASHAVYVEAVYLRAHKQEPFMRLSILNGVLVALGAFLLVPRFGTLGAIGAYAFVMLVVSLPIGTRIFVRFQSEHRGPDSK